MIKDTKNIATSGQKGFTLIEHLFSIIILGFMLTIVMTTFVGVFRFYVWSTTTRNNQAYARQTLDTVTREISSHRIYYDTATKTNPDTAICLVDPNDPNPTLSEAISFTNSTVVIEQHNNGTCTSVISGSTKVISNPNMNVLSDVLKSNFMLINNSINNSYNPQGYHKSVVINMTVVNGVLSSSTNSCRSGDVFCDKSVFVTATIERQTSP